MIMFVLRVVFVTWRALAVLPPVPMPRVLATAIEAVKVELTLGVAAEITMPIAQHESDDEPNAVTWVAADGHRVDLLWDGISPIPPREVCGYLQAMGTPATCRRWIVADGGMRAGAAELVEWLATCRGQLACALRGHAGGTACALDRAACRPNDRAFADLFYTRARAMGWHEQRPAS